MTPDVSVVVITRDRADKLRVMQLLIQELAKEENALLSSNSYAIWSPFDSFEAAVQGSS